MLTMKIHQCKYCGTHLKSKQALSRHQLNRPNKCLLVSSRETSVAGLSIARISIEDEVEKVVSTVNDKTYRILQLQQEISKIESEDLSAEQIEIRALKEQLQKQQNINRTLMVDFQNYKDFYYKYMTADCETLLYYDVNNEVMIKALEERLSDKYSLEKIELQHVGLAFVLYDFFVPKYFRIVKTCDRYIIKTKDCKGHVVEDTDLKILKQCWFKTVLYYLNCFRDDLIDNPRALEILDGLVEDIGYDRIGGIFNSQIFRLADLSDGKEVRKNIEKMTYALNN